MSPAGPDPGGGSPPLAGSTNHTRPLPGRPAAGPPSLDRIRAAVPLLALGLFAFLLSAWLHGEATGFGAGRLPYWFVFFGVGLIAAGGSVGIALFSSAPPDVEAGFLKVRVDEWTELTGRLELLEAASAAPPPPVHPPEPWPIYLESPPPEVLPPLAAGGSTEATSLPGIPVPAPSAELADPLPPLIRVALPTPPGVPVPPEASPESIVEAGWPSSSSPKATAAPVVPTERPHSATAEVTAPPAYLGPVVRSAPVVPEIASLPPSSSIGAGEPPDGPACATCGRAMSKRAAWRKCATCGRTLCASCLTTSVRVHGKGYCRDCSPAPP